MADSQETKTLTAQCYCKSVHYSITLPAASFPLPVQYTHGTLCIFHAVLPKTVEPQFVAPSSLGNLTGYLHSKSKSERFFCSTCGCNVGDRSVEEDSKGEWIMATSLFAEHGEDLFQIKTHCLTDSAPGGGLHQWLPRIGDREMNIWNPSPDNPKWDHTVVESKQEFDANGNERLRASCHCGEVNFTIPRPTISQVQDDAHIKKWVSPVDPEKWMAVLDLCDDCRLVDGTHVVGWTFVPCALIDPPMLPNLENYGKMKVFNSSKGVYRGFCGTCGATVVFSSDTRAPSKETAIIDVTVGILRAPEGVLAEKWLTWRTGRISWKDSGMRYDPAFTKALEEGFAKWGEQKHGKAIDFVIDD